MSLDILFAFDISKYFSFDFQVSFALEANSNDYTLACMRTLFRFYNSAGNAVRHLLVANVCPDLGAEVPECQTGLKLLESLDTLLAQHLVASENQAIVCLSVDQDGSKIPASLPDGLDNRRILIYPNSTYDIPGLDEAFPLTESDCRFHFEPVYHLSRRVAYENGLDLNDWIYEDDFDDTDDEEEWEYWDEVRDQVQGPDLVKIDEGHEVINEDDKLLIVATGTTVNIPHMVGIKRMNKVRFKKHMDQTPLFQRMSERRARRREARIRATDARGEAFFLLISKYASFSRIFFRKCTHCSGLAGLPCCEPHV